ncbi:21826_t:CDS:2, partial [Cetraspora pellucida]
VLKKKSNKYNHFAICNACKEAKDYDYAYSNKFINTKRLVKTYLKNCIYFKNIKGEDEAKRILDDTDIEQKYKGPLDLYVIYELFKPEQSRFALFKFLSPKITLSTCKQLSEKILNKAITKFTSKIKETAKKDKSGQLPKSILQELELYCQKKSPFNTTLSRQFGNDIIGYWSYYATCANELGLVLEK